ncbi:hypothetical protein ACFYKX_11220 [Cytobacillus sp. FJAT-54145]|uniref:Uncharacterized protein n=1 Tax=Cytobacillus spartinae TaxID=3299023 RepID=A0ABW6KD32_9BACI
MLKDSDQTSQTKFVAPVSVTETKFFEDFNRSYERHYNVRKIREEHLQVPVSRCTLDCQLPLAYRHLNIEVDGPHHFWLWYRQKDKRRDWFIGEIMKNRIYRVPYFLLDDPDWRPYTVDLAVYLTRLIEQQDINELFEDVPGII